MNLRGLQFSVSLNLTIVQGSLVHSGPNIFMYRTTVLPSLLQVPESIFPTLIDHEHEISNNLVRYFQATPAVSVVGYQTSQAEIISEVFSQSLDINRFFN